VANHLTGVLSLDLVGGALCLDFTNTVHSHEAKHAADELVVYDDLVLWGRRSGVLEDADAQRLLDLAAAHPRKAQAVLRRARALRRVIFDVFEAIADGCEPNQTDLTRLSDVWRQMIGEGAISRTADGYDWAWHRSPDAMDRMLWPITRSAVDLLTSPDLGRIHKCAAENCTWLFIDLSKNRSRRWCEMSSCGNRAKSRRHYRRKHAG
jgi:predicted RNA-binding Zn ribbon-like protein